MTDYRNSFRRIVLWFVIINYCEMLCNCSTSNHPENKKYSNIPTDKIRKVYVQEGETVSFDCYLYQYNNNTPIHISWLYNKVGLRVAVVEEKVDKNMTEITQKSVLTIFNVTMEATGSYVCSDQYTDQNNHFELIVLARQSLLIDAKTEDNILIINCVLVSRQDKANLSWFKDDLHLEVAAAYDDISFNVTFREDKSDKNKQKFFSTLSLFNVGYAYAGSYCCQDEVTKLSDRVAVDVEDDPLLSHKTPECSENIDCYPYYGECVLSYCSLKQTTIYYSISSSTDSDYFETKKEIPDDSNYRNILIAVFVFTGVIIVLLSFGLMYFLNRPCFGFNRRNEVQPRNSDSPKPIRHNTEKPPTYDECEANLNSKMPSFDTFLSPPTYVTATNAPTTFAQNIRQMQKPE